MLQKITEKSICSFGKSVSKRKRKIKMNTWIKRALILFVIVGAACLTVYLNKMAEAKEENRHLTPQLIEEGSSVDSVLIPMEKKQRLSGGFLSTQGKFGFRKRIVIKESSVLAVSLEQSGIGPVPKGCRYGVYRDIRLNDPLDEIDFEYAAKMENDLEEHSVKNPEQKYPKYRQLIQLRLEPGTYYIAFFSDDPSADGYVLYCSTYRVLPEDLRLNPGEYKLFYADQDHREFLFPFSVKKAGTLEVDTLRVAGTLSLYKKGEEKPRKQVTVNMDAYGFDEAVRIVNFPVDESGEYYFLLTDCSEDYPAFERKMGRAVPEVNQIRYKIKR